MKFEARSNTLLSITRSKAKMYEFAVDSDHHIDLPIPPQNLLTMTIGMLGDLCALELQEENAYSKNENINQARNELRLAAQYFDALDESKLEPEYTNYLRLLGSSAYYLADMPGSSSILAKKLTYHEERLTDSGIEHLLSWLLEGVIETQIEWGFESYFRLKMEQVISSMVSFYQVNEEAGANSFSVAKSLRKDAHSFGTDRELFISDIIAAIVKRKIENSSISLLPKTTGLAIESWRDALQKQTFVREFWPAQILLGESGVFQGESSVVQLPTSAGKTKSTEIIIRSAFLSGRANLAVIVAPFRSLCREISDSLSEAFDGELITVNELIDVPQLDDSDSEFLDLLLDGDEAVIQNSVIISTPEKLLYILRHQPNLAEEIGLLIFDEGHQFDTGSRGVTYELLISSLRNAVSNDSQFVLISAVMSNAGTIGEWLYGEDGTIVNGAHCLPTTRSIAFTSWTSKLGQLKYVNTNDINKEEFFVPRLIEAVNLGRQPREKKDRVFPDKNSAAKSSHMSAYWSLKLSSSGPVAVFCGNKASVNKICKIIVEQYRRGLAIPPPSEYSDLEELTKIASLVRMHLGDESELADAIELGVLPHNANVPNGVRLSVEFAMQNSKGRVVVCTSTLAQGVNLPIKYLVVSGLYQAGEKISTRDFHNLLGRAGRSGLHTEGSIIFSSPEIFDKKSTFKGRHAWSDVQRLLNFENSEQCVSSLKQIIDPFPNIKGVNILKFIENPDKYSSLILKALENQKIDPSEFIFHLDFRKRAIEAVESFLLSYISDFEEVPEDLYEEIVQGTFAYAMCSIEEKKQLTNAFEIIFNRAMAVPKMKQSYYGKALLGISDLNEVSNWVDENYEWMDGEESLEELLADIWPLMMRLCRNPKIHKLGYFEDNEQQSAGLVFATGWLRGLSYTDLVSDIKSQGIGYQRGQKLTEVSIENVIDLADKVLGYDCMLIIGAMADVIDGIHDDSEAISSNLRALQKAIKYGLSKPLSVWLYEKKYADRELCKDLTQLLEKQSIDAYSFQNDVLEANSGVVNSVLNNYPSYFSR